MMRIIRNLCALIILSFIFSIFIFNTPTFANDTEIPKIFLTGDISNMGINNKKKMVFHYEDGAKNFDGYAKIKLQGAASLSFDKKNYTIDLYEDNTYKNKNNVDLGWGEHNKYVLKANWTDKTHSRNIVTANLMADINKQYNLFVFTPNFGEIDGHPVEVYLNDEFFGLYTLNIPKSDWMFDMDKNNPQNILFSSEWWADSSLFKAKMDFDGTWDLEIGDDEGYAVSKFNKMIDFVTSSSDSDFKKNINNYFDLDNLLNYYVFVEYAELLDNVGKNVLAWTYDGDKWFLTLYDLDLSWGVWFESKLDYKSPAEIENILLFKRLRENFPNELADRYFALRKTILTKENILNKFYEFGSKIPESSLEKDRAKWGEPVSFDILQIEEFLDTRTPYVDQLFYDFYTMKPEVHLRYENSKDNSIAKVVLVPNREDIIVDDIDGDSYEFTFSKNGIYEISCHDWLGNYDESFKVEITSIVTPKETPAPYFVVSIASLLACVFTFFIGIRFFLQFRQK